MAALGFGALLVLFGAYAGLATATAWQQALAAAFFVAVAVAWTLYVAGLLRPGARRPRLLLGGGAAVVASLLWLLIFKVP